MITSVFGKQTAAVLEFYFQSVSHSVSDYQPTKFHPNWNMCGTAIFKMGAVSHV